MPEADDFAARRLTGIGGSEAAAVAGVDPWQSPFELYLRKRDELAPVEQSPQMLWGVLLEPLVADEYARRTGRSVFIPPDMLRGEYPWMIGHIDRLVDDGKRILEIKTTRISIGWGEPGTDEIPLHYLPQVHHYLIISGAEVCDVAVLIGGSDFRVYTIEADREIAEALIEQERVFWECVRSGTPPEPANLRDAVLRWGKLDAPGRVLAGENEIAAVEALRMLTRSKKALESEEERHRVTVMQALGDVGDTLIDDSGNVLATWRIDSGRKAYTVAARDPARRLLIKGE